MKDIIDYIIESSENINTKEVINKLKNGGETTKEIQNDVNTNKSTMTYIEFVKLFNKKCMEWFNKFWELHKKIQKAEGDDYLTRNLGKKWTDYFSESFMECTKSIQTLNKILKQNINESIDVKNFDNYKQFYDFLVMLNDFNNMANKIEKSYNDISKYEDVVKVRKQVSDNIEKLFKSTDLLKKFLDVIYQYKNNRLHI